MKTTITDKQAADIMFALESIGVRPFRQESGDPKTNAQRNLCGKTHYVDEETLRWHKSRIVSTAHLCGGLLFKTTASDALNMNNTKRGFRCIVHDVFGSCVWATELEAAKSTSKAAHNECEVAEFDVVTHYKQAFASMIKSAEEKAGNLKKALNRIN